MYTTAYIYKIIQLSTGLIYVGSTISIDARWESHKRTLRSGKHTIRIQEAWESSGESDWEFEILSKVSLQDRFSEEQKFIDRLKPYRQGIGFNISRWAHGCVSSYPEISDDVQGAISDLESEKYTYVQISARRNMSNGLIGLLKRRYLPELCNKHKKLAKEKTARINNERKKAYQRSEERSKKWKAVEGMLSDRETLWSYIEIANKCGVSNGQVGRVAKTIDPMILQRRKYMRKTQLRRKNV